ncbi:MAG: DNA-protecting protein DprA [Gammaproteobacteria bacterium]|nr:DNA-protecting protein DprA [Gammaproteobacteria bacterium]
MALIRTPGLGSRGISRLLDQLDGIDNLFGQAIPPPVAALPAKSKNWLRSPDWTLIDQDLTWLEQPDHHLITLDNSGYPALLAAIDDPPPVLFVSGNPDNLSLPQLAIVGSRNPSAGGLHNAREFAAYLSAAGIAITSGLALGIDGASHQGALNSEGITLAVTGTGLDRIYPARHRQLAHEILERGSIISEFPLGTQARPGHFPRRNRIISGLSVGTLVVEAAPKSGSLITARLALEQGRDVFAIPGSIHNPLARGCHALIREGAKLVETAEDIIEELGAMLGHIAIPDEQSNLGDQKQGEWDADYQKLIHALGHDPVTVDLLVERSGLTAEAVSSMLLLLELEGYVSSAPGGRFCMTAKSTKS